VTLCILIMLAVTAIMVRCSPCTSHTHYLDGIAIECVQLLALHHGALWEPSSLFLWPAAGYKESCKMKELPRSCLLLRAAGS